MVDNLTSKLSKNELIIARQKLKSVNPDDGRYSQNDLTPYLSLEGELVACAFLQQVLLETRAKYDSKVTEDDIIVIRKAVINFDPLNAVLIEKEITKHDQLGVIQELGRHTGKEVESLLHPGTTSYDIYDTARSYLLKNCWNDIFKPKAKEVVNQLCELSDIFIDVMQVGRTHLQYTSPILFGGHLAGYAARLANRIEKGNQTFNDLRGKISGIVGTGASIDVVIGENKSIEFERNVLSKLNLEPDYTATQVVQKERLADVGNTIVTMMHVLGDFANDMRLLYSSDVGEVSSRDEGARLGGSSADAAKNNPINWENVAGKTVVVESGMRVLYELISTDLQRDLRGSVQARYQPQGIISETYESLCRTSKALKTLSVNNETMVKNLEKVRKFPSEAMVAVTRAHGWNHPEFGVGHDAVKKISIEAKKSGETLLLTAMRDDSFREFYQELPSNHRRILEGQLELYTGSAKVRARKNIAYAKSVI